EVEMVQIPAALLKEYLDGSLPIRSLTGYLGQRVHIEGSPETSLRLKGDLEFRGLRLEAPEFFAAPIGGADGHMTFDFDWRPERVQIKRADVRANGINFSLRGDIAALDSRDPRIRLTLSGLSVPAPALRSYLPLKILNSAGLEKTVKAIETGQVEIKQAAIDATLGELRHLAENHARPLRMEAELRDIAVALPERGALPLHIVDGRIQWANGVLSAINLRAEYGDSRFSDIDGSCDFSTAGCGTFDVTAKGDINLGELKEQIHREWFPLPFAKVAPSVQELGGRAKIDLVLQRSPKSPMRFEGKAVLGNARLRYDRYALSDIRGTLSLTPTKISGEKIHALLGGSPIEVQISLADYDAPNGSFDLVIESSGVKAGLVASLLLDTGSPQDPGTVRGSVHYWGPLSHDERKFTGDLDLVNVQLLVHPLLQPLRELNGQIRIDEAGIDFQNLRALLVGVPASLSGRWRYTSSPQLLFDFAAPNLDITYLISQIDPESSEFYANLVAEGKITLGKGRIKDFDFSNLRTNASIDHRVWRLTGLTARSAGGTIQGVTTIFDRPETLAVVAEPKIQNVPIQSFLNWFSATTTEMTGKVELTGRLETVGISDAERKRNLSGAFKLRVKEGTINRMRIVVQILNLLDLSRWFTFQLPDLAKQGIRFRSITGNFTVNHGVFSTENLFVDSDDLRMTGIGKIDLPKDELDFIVAVRPFAGIDSAINQIPILGRGIAAIKNSFLVASFNIRGKIDNPTITPAPLGTLSEMFWSVLGIPKNIISSGEGQKKGQPQTGGKPGASP
ncbi:MAG TPA: AsmA-like C-terminal domain-containing protein, partial [Terriglobales bacterium]|nr:AsmA-like C-terminal domain-containing protein [Terriglobales bacterium]